MEWGSYLAASGNIRPDVCGRRKAEHDLSGGSPYRPCIRHICCHVGEVLGWSLEGLEICSITEVESWR
jgi:hypothetical protein